ncbi:MAG: CvpA family protein [Bacteroidales bacterium]|jgi:membrane protein required for colicin V production|nr:CvpA family protein [Bacteroidales bacterium]
MNWLDIIFIIPLCWLGFTGMRKGFIMEIASLLAIIAGICIAYNFSEFVCEWLGLEGVGSGAIAFAITFLAVLIGVFFLGKAISAIAKKLSLSFFNRILGLAFGLLKALLFCGITVYLIISLDPACKFIGASLRDDSLFFRWIEGLVVWVMA